ncbi:MAG: type II toxin-antitoxin system RelE/ParE family toxin [Thermoanaerobaculia bacterium]|nr:type II toxin-antitoxin system RelE/ParE family toxin [Thermoanaerobaculia bacterium]
MEESVTYILEQSGPVRAADWLAAMRSSIGELSSTPRAYPVVAHQGGRAVHSKVIMTNRVFYFVDDSECLVFVIDVVHTARETKLLEYRER